MMAKQMPKGLIIDPKCELHCKPRGQRMARKKDLRPCIEQGAGNGWAYRRRQGNGLAQSQSSQLRCGRMRQGCCTIAVWLLCLRSLGRLHDDGLSGNHTMWS